MNVIVLKYELELYAVGWTGHGEGGGGHGLVDGVDVVPGNDFARSSSHISDLEVSKINYVSTRRRSLRLTFGR